MARRRSRAARRPQSEWIRRNRSGRRGAEGARSFASNQESAGGLTAQRRAQAVRKNMSSSRSCSTSVLMGAARWLAGLRSERRRRVAGSSPLAVRPLAGIRQPVSKLEDLGCGFGLGFFRDSGCCPVPPAERGHHQQNAKPTAGFPQPIGVRQGEGGAGHKQSVRSQSDSCFRKAISYRRVNRPLQPTNRADSQLLHNLREDRTGDHSEPYL